MNYCLPEKSAEGIRSGEPLRVLHLSSGNIYGGVETLLGSLAQYRQLCPAMEPSFGLCYEGRLSRELIDAGVSVYVLGNVRARYPWTVWQARRRLRDLLRSQRFDVVICHMTWTLAIFGPVVRSQHLPVVFYLHGRTEGRHWIDRWARSTVTPDLALCVSKDTAETCSEIYPSVVRRVSYCPLPPKNGVSFETDRPQVRAEFETPENATVIVQVSRMEPGKGHKSLLEALARLQGKREWICWIVGGAQTTAEEAYLEGLKTTANHFSIAERIRFVGYRTDVSRLLGAADIFCQPNTIGEGFSLIFMEAFLASLPIVTTAIGGAAELIDSSCGILVPPNQMEALTDALQVLIERPHLRESLGATGFQRVHELCQPERQMQKLIKILAELGSTHKPERN